MAKIIVALLYILAILIIGIIGGRKVKTADDFATANRKIPFWTNVYSMSSAWIGAGATLGCASMCYAFGVQGFYLAISVGIGAILASLLFSKRIREANVTTIPELIRKYLGPRVADWISVLTIFQIFGIAASQIRALGTILQMFIPSLGLLAAIVIMSGVMLVYTVIGGIVSATKTDKLNISLMVLSVMVIIPIIALSKSGGLGGFASKVDASFLTLKHMGIGAMISSGLYFCTSNMLNSENFLRVCGARTAAEARNASLTATLLIYIPYLLFASLAGLLGLVLIPQLGTSDSILPAMVNTLTNPILGAFLLAALLAAVMGTAASVTMLTSITLTRDVIARIKPIEGNTMLNIQRIVTIVVAVLGIIVGYFGSSIVSIMENVGAPCGAALVPILCGIFFWQEKMNEKGTLITIIVAVVTTLGYLALGSPLGISHFLFGIICATVTMFVANGICHTAGKKKNGAKGV